MRLVIDLQGAQSTGSRSRGIGRYTMALAEAIIRLRGEHEVWLVLNNSFADTIEGIRGHFAAILPAENIRVWSGPPSVSEVGSEGNAWRRQASELLLETFISQLRPDVVLVTSLFEGLVDDAVTSIGQLYRGIPTAVVLYDLIPLMNRKLYLDNPAVEAWYERKLTHARRAGLLLAISESSRLEAINHLAVSPDDCVAISTAADPHFSPISLSESTIEELRRQYCLQRPFLMYTGGIDHRKNIEGLIRAFAALPAKIRLAHQLVIVCSIHAADRERLSLIAGNLGLGHEEVLFTGFVSDADLLALYNLCTLFVFPSWHEGFGLPALEAMSCGCAVIASNTSSLPEVVGRGDAMFDPFNEDEITKKIASVLDNPEYINDLRRHGLDQSRRFSWDITGARALRAIEELHAKTASYRLPMAVPTSASRRLRLAVVTPLEPQRTGIANYVSELLPELARYYDIDLIVDQRDVSDPWVLANGRVRTAQWLVKNARQFDRVLYHMGNSEFHRHIFSLLDEVPGVVVLHEFYLGHLVEHMHGTGMRAGERIQSLYRSHGYNAVQVALNAPTGEQIAWEYPCNLDVVQQARGVIVHSNEMCRLARHWFGRGAADDWAVIPHLRARGTALSKASARRSLGIGEEDFLVCSFGMIGPSKLSQVLMAAWLESAAFHDNRCRLIFVGANDSGEYGATLSGQIEETGSIDRILITGWVDAERYRLYLAAADVAVQLRGRSRGETSGAVLDCLNAGLATIINQHGSMAELVEGTVWPLPDRFTDRDLMAALETLWREEDLRADIGQRGRSEIEVRHSPRHCAELYAYELERMYAAPSRDGSDLVRAIAAIEPPSLQLWDWQIFAQAAAASLPPRPTKPQLFVDVSTIAQTDARTGIQRVVRAVLHQWLTASPDKFRIEPVYASEEGVYRYAHHYTMQFLGGTRDRTGDVPIDVWAGDVFIALDLNPNMTEAHLAYQQNLRRLGVTVVYVVYDLLPVLLPQRFWEDATRQHHRWLNAVAAADRAVCISKSVADELFRWLNTFGDPRPRPLAIDWFHLGADVETSAPTKGLPPRAEATLKRLSDATALLMLSTLEPRKRHDQVLGAMEYLWKEGNDSLLVLAGKTGWQMDELTQRIRQHPELNRRLFWFESASDEWIAQLYSVCDGVVVASEGEGFGLPIVEAARHELPLLLRDIPVFREIAGECATFFNTTNSQDLATKMNIWIDDLRTGSAIKSTGIPFVSWETSAKTLIAKLFADPPYQRWRHNGTYRFSGSDIRLKTDVGDRINGSMVTTGRAGFLTWGPFMELPSGSFSIEILGKIGLLGREGSYFEITTDGGKNVLFKASFDSDESNAGSLLRSSFLAGQKCTGLELRTWVTETTVARIDTLSIRRHASDKRSTLG